MFVGVVALRYQHQTTPANIVRVQWLAFNISLIVSSQSEILKVALSLSCSEHNSYWLVFFANSFYPSCKNS